MPIPGCPYYTAHALARTADLIILPYQFLLSPAYLSRSRLPLAGSVLIIDEAHNVEQVRPFLLALLIFIEIIAHSFYDVPDVSRRRFRVFSALPSYSIFGHS